MEFTVSMGLWALIVLIAGAVAVGAVYQVIGEAHYRYEWLVTAIGAGIGAFVASEFIVGFRDWEPVFDGLALVPALIAGLIVGGVVAASTRYLTSGHHGTPQAV